MFDREQIARAVALSRHGLELMQWIGDAVTRGAVSFSRAHGTMSMPAAARDWIERNYDSLPLRFRPSRDDLPAFANLASTYLDTSFDLRPAGGTRLASRCGCFCPWCTALVDVPSLRPKRLTRSDKERAHQLMRALLRDRAAAQGLELTADACERMLQPSDLREAVALTAWTHELLRRLDGYVTGPAVLALWRLFAWTPAGSPRPNFQLRVDDILAADAAVDAAIDAELVRALA